MEKQNKATKANPGLSGFGEAGGSTDAPPLARLLKYCEQKEGRQLERVGKEVWLNNCGIYSCVSAPGFEKIRAPTHDTENDGIKPLFE